MKNKSIDIILIISIASLLALWTVTLGELIGPDTCQHATTNIFIFDFLKDLVFLKPFKEMWNYTWTYYTHYPAIGLLHWRPSFIASKDFIF